MKATITAGLVTLGLMLAPVAASAQGKVLTGETTKPGGAVHALLTSTGMAVQRSGVGSLQVQAGQAATASVLNLAMAKSDIVTVPGIVHALLSAGKGPYAKLGAEQGEALAGNLRAIFGAQSGFYLPIVFSDSGITSWEQIKGRRVYVGPPSGAAAVAQMAMIEAVTGFTSGTDYTEVRMDWASAPQGFLDGRFDVLMIPLSAPSPILDRISASADVTILGVPEDIRESAAWKAVANASGAAEGFHPLDAYEGRVAHVNAAEDGIPVLAYTHYVGVHRDMDEEEVFAITRTIIDNLDEINASAAFMPAMRISEAVTGLEQMPGLKMHPGAVRAWEAAGVVIPGSLK